MSVETFAATISPTRRRARLGSSLVGAELLKLRKRRGLVLSAFGLTVVPMIVGYTVMTVLHATDPVHHGTAGGVENFAPSVGLLSGLVTVAAILIGTVAGTGDLRAGVFRELVLTGRSRLTLFTARVPGGLALLLPLVATGFATAGVASVALAGTEPAPGARLIVLSGAWIALHATFTFLLALGVSSAVGSTGPSVAVLLGWQFVLAPIVYSIGVLGTLRELLPGAAIVAVAPAGLELESAISMSGAAAAASLIFWVLLPLGVGAWRTVTRDA